MINPFKALGDLSAMRKQAQAIQQALEAEEFTVSAGNVTIVISGNQNVRSVTVDGLPNESIKQAVNDAIKKSQQAAAMKLAEISKNLNIQQ